MSVRTWRCRRQRDGIVCATLNLRVKQRCTSCGAPRPTPRKPAHRAVLTDMPYEQWVQRFGERCAICGKSPKPGKRLDRDHCHATGAARGLLCGMPCNRFLASWLTPAWLRAAADYLERPALQERQYMDGGMPGGTCPCGNPDPGIKPGGGCWCSIGHPAAVVEADARFRTPTA